MGQIDSAGRIPNGSHAAETKDPWRDARPAFMCCSVSVICCGLSYPSGMPAAVRANL